MRPWDFDTLPIKLGPFQLVGYAARKVDGEMVLSSVLIQDRVKINHEECDHPTDPEIPNYYYPVVPMESELLSMDKLATDRRN